MVRSTERSTALLAGLITLLALADGVLHLSLDFVLFRGNVFGQLGPPPGAPPPPPGGGGGGPPPLPLPLNQLFALNLIGYAALVLLLWFVAPRLGTWRWLVDAAFLVYIALVFAGWLRLGAPNPMGYLGYLSKSIELVLVLAVLARLWTSVAVSRVPLSSAPAP
jgi:hypothetical protein